MNRWYLENWEIVKQENILGRDFRVNKHSTGKVSLGDCRNLSFSEGNVGIKLLNAWMSFTNFFKITLDKTFGCIWHVVSGEEYGFSLDYEVGSTTFHEWL